MKSGANVLNSRCGEHVRFKQQQSFLNQGFIVRNRSVVALANNNCHKTDADGVFILESTLDYSAQENSSSYGKALHWRANQDFTEYPSSTINLLPSASLLRIAARGTVQASR